MSAPHSSGARIPKSQNINPPSAPCNKATTTSPLTVGRMATVKFWSRARWCSSRSGIACLIAPGQRVTVAQKEKQQVHHHEQADGEVNRHLADVDRLSGQELTDLQQAGG